jgi:hypothetical protein
MLRRDNENPSWNDADRRNLRILVHRVALSMKLFIAICITALFVWWAWSQPAQQPGDFNQTTAESSQ